VSTARHLEDRSSEVEETLEHMASFRWDSAGVDNTIFLSTKGYARHAARIKVAIDPLDTLDVTAITASIAVHDGSLVDGKMPPALLRRVQRFIDLNREPILRYWSNEIDAFAWKTHGRVAAAAWRGILVAILTGNRLRLS
jgi:hypothetical protein